MGTRQIRVSEDLYARIEAENRADETMSETIERLLSDYSLTDFADEAAGIDAFDPEAFEAELEADDEAATEELDEHLHL